MLLAPLHRQVFKTLQNGQTVGLEAVRWIEEAKERCGTLEDSTVGFGPTRASPNPGVSQPSALEGQGSIMAGSDDG